MCAEGVRFWLSSVVRPSFLANLALRTARRSPPRPQGCASGARGRVLAAGRGAGVRAGSGGGGGSAPGASLGCGTRCGRKSRRGAYAKAAASWRVAWSAVDVLGAENAFSPIVQGLGLELRPSAGFRQGSRKTGLIALKGLFLRPGCLWEQAARGAMLEWPGGQRMVSPGRRAAPCSSEGGDSLGCYRFRIAACDCGRRVAAGGGGVRQDAREAP